MSLRNFRVQKTLLNKLLTSDGKRILMDDIELFEVEIVETVANIQSNCPDFGELLLTFLNIF